ncbi:MAG: beta family protein [Chloroflexi bacterium]|nr:beta family protein [Chloroflexota bacterium]
MPETFEGLPLSQGNADSILLDGLRGYVPALQSKVGELEALQHASATVWEQIAPWIRVSQRRDPPLENTVSSWATRIHAAVQSRPFFLDVLRPSPNAQIDTRAGPRLLVDVVYGAARRKGLCFTPVMLASDAGNPVGTAAIQASRDGQGLAIRIDTIEVGGSAGHPATLSKAVEATGLTAADIDLIIDAGFIGDYEDGDLELVADVVQELGELDKWRNLVTVATSIPKTLTAIREGTTGPLPRREWALWCKLVRRGGRVPTFGDYAIQHPIPPEEGGPGMRTNIRYTLGECTLVARGRQLTQTGPAEYKILSSRIVGSGSFKGPQFSWGDDVIAGCAEGRIPPGTQHMWRGAGTSHHLALVAEQLRQFRP